MSTSNNLYGSINVQEITCLPDGTISHLSNNFLKLKKNESVYAVHPFFESIAASLPETQDTFQLYPCVHLDIGNLSLICDVTIKQEPQHTTITVFDYTKPYNSLNQVAQERNVSIIQSQRLLLKNQLLERQKIFKDKFLANISHEIRTPLNAILGFTELLNKTNLSLEQSEWVNVITSASDQLTSLIDDMLDVAKIEMGELNIKEEPFLIKDVVHQITKIYTPIACKKNITFSVDYDDAILSKTIGDAVRLQQVLSNLVENAIKYTPKGQVTLSVKKGYQHANKMGVEFAVKDSGIGIAQDKQKEIFNSFYQIDTTSDSQGTGLGLSIIQNIVNQLGGNIQVESLLGKGSTFRVYIPFKLNIMGTEVAAKRGRKPKSVFEDDVKFNLLLVENSEINQLLVIKTLLNHGSFYVDVASDGEKALKYIKLRDYDAVLMDLKMPVMDGFETTKAIRGLKDTSLNKIPIIALTGFATLQQENKCKEAGMDAYVTKPFKQHELITVLEDIFKKHKKY